MARQTDIQNLSVLYKSAQNQNIYRPNQLIDFTGEQAYVLLPPSCPPRDKHQIPREHTNKKKIVCANRLANCYCARDYPKALFKCVVDSQSKIVPKSNKKSFFMPESWSFYNKKEKIC